MFKGSPLEMLGKDSSWTSISENMNAKLGKQHISPRSQT